jgi:hypothetical protein
MSVPGSIFYSANMSIPEGSEDPMAYLRTPVVQAFGKPPLLNHRMGIEEGLLCPMLRVTAARFIWSNRERECCLLVLNSVASTPPWIRQPKPRDDVHGWLFLFSDWIGLIAIGWCTVTLAVKLVYFKPPSNTEAGRTVLYYFGYNEKGMVSFWVNLFAAVAYWAKMASHVSGDQLDDAPYSLILYTYGTLKHRASNAEGIL